MNTEPQHQPPVTHVVHVEDTDTWRYAMVRLLGRLGVTYEQYETAAAGITAIHRLSEEELQGTIVATDFQLLDKDLDGVDVVEAARNIGLPVQLGTSLIDTKCPEIYRGNIPVTKEALISWVEVTVSTRRGV